MLAKLQLINPEVTQIDNQFYLRNIHIATLTSSGVVGDSPTGELIWNPSYLQYITVYRKPRREVLYL